MGTRLQVMNERSRICQFAREIGDLGIIIWSNKKKKLKYLMQPGLRNSEFTYHGLSVEPATYKLKTYLPEGLVKRITHPP